MGGFDLSKTRPDFETIIVGAGYAGLIAARDLFEAGQDVVLLEASDRVGGRAWSKAFPNTEAIVDWGAEWILPDHHHALMAEAKRYGVTLEPPADPTTQNWIIGNEKRVASYHQLLQDRPGFARILAELEAQSHAYATHRIEPDISLAEAITQIAETQLDTGLAEAALFPLTGANPSALSVAMVFNEVRFHGGSIHETIEPDEINRLVGGTTAVAKGIAKELGQRLRFNHPVSRIEDHGDHVNVSGAFGNITGKKCIVALPLRTLTSVEFAPDLTVEQLRLASQGNAGRTIKLWALVEGPTHPEQCLLTGHKVRLTYARHIGNSQYLICAQALADEVIDRSEAGLKAIFSALYPNHEIIAGECYDWVAEPLSRASWQSGAVGCTEAVATQFQTQGNLTFCGGDFMDPWCGWIEGAILSGQRAAMLAVR